MIRIMSHRSHFRRALMQDQYSFQTGAFYFFNNGSNIKMEKTKKIRKTENLRQKKRNFMTFLFFLFFWSFYSLRRLFYFLLFNFFRRLMDGSLDSGDGYAFDNYYSFLIFMSFISFDFYFFFFSSSSACMHVRSLARSLQSYGFN
jgi:hypothetical protein